MNYKEEYKKLKKEMFLMRFTADIEKFKNEHRFEYDKILSEIKDSLLDVYIVDTSGLKELIKKFNQKILSNFNIAS